MSRRVEPDAKVPARQSDRLGIGSADVIGFPEVIVPGLVGTCAGWVIAACFLSCLLSSTHSGQCISTVRVKQDARRLSERSFLNKNAHPCWSSLLIWRAIDRKVLTEELSVNNIDRDLVLVLLVLAVGLCPFLVLFWRERRGRGALGIASVIVGSFAVVLFGATMRTPPSTESPERSVGPIEIDGDGYVGSEVCVSCHPYQHATWHASYHRTMTQWADSETIQASFDGTSLTLEGKTWQLSRDGEEFRVTRTDSQPPESRRVAMATGSHNY